MMEVVYTEIQNKEDETKVYVSNNEESGLFVSAVKGDTQIDFQIDDELWDWMAYMRSRSTKRVIIKE